MTFHLRFDVELFIVTITFEKRHPGFLKTLVNTVLYHKLYHFYEESSIWLLESALVAGHSFMYLSRNGTVHNTAAMPEKRCFVLCLTYSFASS